MADFEFTLVGIPVSANQRKKNPTLYQTWLALVRRTALQYWSDDALPTSDWVRVEILYFYGSDDCLDADNIIKSILDALNSVAYIDDHQVLDMICRKRSLQGIYRFLDGRFDELAIRLEDQKPFIYVKIAGIGDLEEIGSW